MNQDTITYLLLFIIALAACIVLFKIGKTIICFILLLLALYCGVQSVLYYLAADYELPDVEVISEEIEDMDLPDVKISLPIISYEEDPNAIGFGMDGVLGKD